VKVKDTQDSSMTLFTQRQL